MLCAAEYAEISPRDNTNPRTLSRASALAIASLSLMSANELINKIIGIKRGMASRTNSTAALPSSERIIALKFFMKAFQQPLCQLLLFGDLD